MIRHATEALEPNFRLPNGLHVCSLNGHDTETIYRDIFEDDCYRRHGITIEDGDCIFDIGANTGLFLLFLNQLGVDLRVFSFEPAPATFAVLQRNAELHDRLSAQLFNVGLSKQSGRMEFTYYPRFSNASTFYPDDPREEFRTNRPFILEQLEDQVGIQWGRPWKAMFKWLPGSIKNFFANWVYRYHMKYERVECEVWRLSDVLRRFDVERVDLLKIDAEKSEERILEGIDEADWPRIHQVIVEVHGGESAMESMRDLFESRGFHTAVDPNPAMPNLSLLFGRRTKKPRRRSTPQLAGGVPRS